MKLTHTAILIACSTLLASDLACCWSEAWSNEGASCKGRIKWLRGLGIILSHQCCPLSVGVRLYKETSAEPAPSPSPSKPTKGGKDQAGTKGKGTKGRGKKLKKQGGLGGSWMGPPAEPSWELLAGSTDELQAVGEDLTGQKANAEADIGYQVMLQFQLHPMCAAVNIVHT